MQSVTASESWVAIRRSCKCGAQTPVGQTLPGELQGAVRCEQAEQQSVPGGVPYRSQIYKVQDSNKHLPNARSDASTGSRCRHKVISSGLGLTPGNDREDNKVK